MHATATTPLTMPVKLGSAADTLEHANQYEVGFVSASAPPTQQRVRAQPAKPTKPVAWPSHMFYAYDTESSMWKAAVHADVWYTKPQANGNRFVPQKRNKNRKPVFCSQLIPVNISNFGELERAPTLLEVSDAVDTAVRRLNFLRFGIATQKY